MKNDMIEMKAWECTDCGYVLSDISYREAKYNYLCPRCGHVHIRDFKRISWFSAVGDSNE